MFKRKYNTSLLDSKWNPIKRNLKLSIIPRIHEYIYHEDKYYMVLNVVHQLNDKHDIFIIVEEKDNSKLNDSKSIS
jgi:hypothetical protein